MFQSQYLVGIAKRYIVLDPDIRYQVTLFVQFYEKAAKVDNALRSNKRKIFGQSQSPFACFAIRSGDVHQ